ncbi:putative RNA polymerase II-associated protein 1 [Hypsibius exemplaris]|uniref:RNA polymerase II-associated protein 1 n=1 Tax=Hypsibius exemplaris TaxID=2072580 RepID=A0A1W0X692_HYPEX|nr:putative RNA polymerase II-associated protein 1 [Hypsibius exemplaris]
MDATTRPRSRYYMEKVRAKAGATATEPPANTPAVADSTETHSAISDTQNQPAVGCFHSHTLAPQELIPSGKSACRAVNSPSNLPSHGAERPLDETFRDIEVAGVPARSAARNGSLHAVAHNLPEISPNSLPSDKPMVSPSFDVVGTVEGPAAEKRLHDDVLMENVQERSNGSANSAAVDLQEIIPLERAKDRTTVAWSTETVRGVGTELERKLRDHLPEGVAEPDKLAWTAPIDPSVLVSSADNSEKAAESKKKEDLFEARFDHAGTILRPDSDIPVTAGLHHHGDDPEKPGYTLDEIFTLLQSSSHPQKLWALGTLTAILHQAKLSVYDEYLEASLLGKMVQEDMILALRHLLDHGSVAIVSATLRTIEALLVNDVDEFMTDQLLILDRNPLFFELNPSDPDDADPDVGEEDLTDAQLMKTDIVKGFLRTSILKRFEFLLDAYLNAMDAASISSLLAIITRCARHSREVAQQLVQEAVLMDLLMSPVVTAKSPIAQMKLVRVLTSLLGPLGQTPWAERIYHTAAGWISSMRIVIDDTVIRDMVTESLNLLIVLGHYGVCPASISGIEDVFPQVLHSAGPKANGSITKWDAGCCSRILTFLSLCLPLEAGKSPLISDAMAMLIMQNILSGYLALEKSDKKQRDVVNQLRASYLLFATEYVATQRPERERLINPLINNLRTALPTLLAVSWIVEREESIISTADPPTLPSYGIVERGGRSVLLMFERRSNLSLSIQALRFFNVASVDLKLSPFAVSQVNEQLAEISSFKCGAKEFWSSYYVRVLVQTVKFGLAALEAKLDIECGLLYSSALALVPYIGEHQANDLKILLTKLIFNPAILPKSTIGLEGEEPITSVNQLEDMNAIREVFSFLRPLGFVEDVQLPLAVPSRAVGVFTRTWIFDCFSYVLEWGATSEKIKQAMPSSRDHCIRGYFYWLVHLTRHITTSKHPILPLSELYVSLGEFFGEDGHYRDEVVRACLKLILRLLVTGPKKLTLKPEFVSHGKAFDDFYDALLDNYEASSYGDHVFATYILIPIQQRYATVFREKFWGPEKQIFSVVRLHHLDLCYPVELHLEPGEENLNLLGQYFTLLMTQNVTEQRTPLLFLICVDQLRRFLLRPDSERGSGLRKKVLLFLRSNPTVFLRHCFVRFKRPSTTRDGSVIEFFEEDSADFLQIL